MTQIRDIIQGGFSYKLPAETVDIVREMCREMNVDTVFVRARDFSAAAAQSKRGGGGGRRRGGGAAAAADDWETVAAPAAAFKKTALNTPKEGVEGQITEIRTCLNKITAKNADKQYEVLLDIVRAIFGAFDLSSPEIARVVQLILDNCSLNKFYSDVFVDVYSKLMSEYVIFRETAHTHFAREFMKSFEELKYKPNSTGATEGEEYENFCRYNKENENRRAKSMFYINLMKRGAVEHTDILACMMFLLERVFLWIDEPDRANEVEEITENIYLFVVNTQTRLLNYPEWDEILEKIQVLSQMKHYSHPSITNRAIFKYMDLIDSL